MHRTDHQFTRKESPHFSMLGGTVVPTYPHYATWMYPFWGYGGGWTASATAPYLPDGANSGQADGGGDSGGGGGDGGGAAA